MYYSDYWDGPLSGMLSWNGQKYWFEAYRYSDQYHSERRYVLLEISEEDLVKEAIQHQLWVECCGNNCFDLPANHKPTKPIDLYYTTYPVDKIERPKGKPVAHIREPSERQKFS